MIKIHASFQRLDRITLVDAYDEIGVYVLWSSKATVRPSYIGEGNVLERFAAHMAKSWAARPLHGSMALLRDGGQLKAQAELVEAALLGVAEQIDRYPPNNEAPGKARSALNRLLKRADHDARTVRIVISGQDPLLPPERPPMQRDKWIVLREDPHGTWSLDEHNWNKRPA